MSRKLKLLARPCALLVGFASMHACSTEKSASKPHATISIASLSHQEQALEREFWEITEDPNAKGIEAWQEKARWLNLQHGASNLKRLNLLQPFACLRSLVGYNVSRLADCFFQAEQAVHLNPTNFNALAVYNFQSATLQMVLGNEDRALEHIEVLKTLGSEGRATAAIAYSYWSNNRFVKEAAEILGDCENDACQKTTALAPHKELGMLIVLAEVQTKMGRTLEVQTTLNKIRRLGSERQWPFLGDIDKIEVELAQKKAAWESGKFSLGFLAMPLPPSTGPRACAQCHYGASRSFE